MSQKFSYKTDSSILLLALVFNNLNSFSIQQTTVALTIKKHKTFHEKNIETKAYTDKNSNKKKYLHSHWMQDIHFLYMLLLHIVE